MPSLKHATRRGDRAVANPKERARQREAAEARAENDRQKERLRREGWPI
jgi:hypothetical protein